MAHQKKINAEQSKATDAVFKAQVGAIKNILIENNIVTEKEIDDRTDDILDDILYEILTDTKLI